MRLIGKIIGLELLLLIFYTANGAYSSIAEPSSPLLQFIGLVPLAAGIVIYLLVKRKGSYYFFIGEKSFFYTVPLILVLVVILIGNRGLDMGSVSDLLWMLIMQVAVVGLIEETFFRGFMLRVLLGKGVKQAVMLTSVLFAITHAIQLLSGQSVQETILQIIYAFVVGLVLALLIVHKQSILITIGFHGLNNFLNFMGNRESPLFYAYIILAILLVTAIILWKRLDNKASIRSEITAGF